MDDESGDRFVLFDDLDLFDDPFFSFRFFVSRDGDADDADEIEPDEDDEERERERDDE